MLLCGVAPLRSTSTQNTQKDYFHKSPGEAFITATKFASLLIFPIWHYSLRVSSRFIKIDGGMLDRYRVRC